MSENDVAIVGIAAHLPGARNPGEYWSNLREGVESVRELSDDELTAAGVGREEMRRPGYVKSASPLDGVFDFDADFFGFSPKEAGIMDPQHRHFLMAAWEAMEDAGHTPERFDGSVGVFAGCGVGSYYMLNLLSNPDLVHDVGLFLLRHTGNDKDFLATRASYLFDLRGPSINVQTACSTSLVATHLAVQHLLSGECDLALAGGVTIEIPHGHGYQYHEGEVLSPDGHCRAFDHRAQGTVFGSGVGVVALRRLQDAVDDGDQIYAVIKGTAVNNDGTQKVGYLAPSVDGQAACVAEALAVADVEPQTINYIECHGTGTPVGDPIEIAALTQAFRAGTDKSGFCRIGSVKTNIGHLDTAAGVASLIKVALALKHREVPPSLNFEASNPLLELEDSPFIVNDALIEWRQEGSTPRRAGVNSLGVGGTNAFVVLEEAPARAPSPSAPAWRLLTISGKNRGAVDDNASRLASHLKANPDVDLGDLAWSLQESRKHFPERRVLAARDAAEVVELIEKRDARRVFSHNALPDRVIALMFPGGGAQHVGMAAGVYAAEPVFAQHIDAGLSLLETHHGIDLRDLVMGTGRAAEARAAADDELRLMTNQLPAIFLVEYALTQLLISWGIEFNALVGHSVGENTAACVAGTMSFADCLGLVVLRGQLMDSVAGGATAVPLAPADASRFAAEFGLDLAVVNAPELSVVSGETERLADFEAKLRGEGIEGQRVKLNVAAHSRVLDPILAEFRRYLESITLSPPTIPWVSNRTGTWITADQACDPGYWVEHIRNTVLFSDCITTLAADPGRVLLEVGPGKMLSSLARMNPELKSTQAAIPTMRHPDEDVDDEAFLLTTLGRLWAIGVELTSTALRERLFADDGQRLRVSLPTYAFQTQPFFIAPGAAGTRAPSQSTYLDRESEESRWLWEPVWKSRDRDDAISDNVTWLVVADQPGVADDVIPQLRARGDDVVVVRTGDSYVAMSEFEYVIAPENGLADYESLFRDLVRTGRVPDRIAHLALLATDDRQFRLGSSFFHRNQELGFQSLVFIAQAWAATGLQRPLHITVATMGSQRVVPSDLVQWPEQSTVLGPVRVIPREFADVTVSTFDIDQLDLFPESRLRKGLGVFADSVSEVRSVGIAAALRRRDSATPNADPNVGRRETLVRAVIAELAGPAANEVVALRGDRRFVQEIRRVAPPAQTDPTVDDHSDSCPLRQGGAVLITGGLGGIGLAVAEHLFETAHAKLALLSRSTLPDRAAWSELTTRLGPDHPTSARIARILELESRGAAILLLAGDITDVERMHEVAGEIRTRWGGLHGVVHAAGVVDDALMVTKTTTEMEEVLAPKVYGTLVLRDATASDSLDLFVVFSSTSTATAPLGQVDYVAANAFLNAFVENRRAIGRAEFTAINWGVWNEVGMAAAAAARLQPASEPEPVACAHPFFDTRSTDRHGVTRLAARWHTEREWFLDDHRTAGGDALLPGAGYVELVRGALDEIGVTRPFEIRDLTFLRPLAAPDDGFVDIQVVLTPNESGYHMAVSEAVTVEASSTEDGPATGRRGWRQAAEAALWLTELPDSTSIDLAAEAADCPTRETTRTHQQDHLRFGPRWDVVQSVVRNERTALAWLRLPEQFAADIDPDDIHSLGAHPALVDLGTGFAMSLIDGYTGDRLWVPLSYRSIKVHGRLGREVVARATIRPGSTEANGFASFDVVLCDPSGRVVLAVEQFTIKRLDGPLDTGLGKRAVATDLTFDHLAADRQPSQSELAFHHNLSQGIVPDEGKRMFDRAIARTKDGVIYVSSLDLSQLRDQAESAAASQTKQASPDSSAVFGRPNLDNDYVEPRNDIEQGLVELWQELLGISQIGVLDSFFDLGGHSLIAVRLFARVKKTYSVEFPISVLFEAPTIEACAALIAAARPSAASIEPTGAAGSEAAASSILATRPRYTHLVAMHPGEGGPKTPFFLVAGMFGNVLNLRHLASLVGHDRPFYGVQAKGLFGGEVPHDDFGDMARAYLEEIRTVQPHGPYLLGGFSGGGLAAYEMAQQLLADGEDIGALVLLDTPLAENDPLRFSDRVKIQRDNVADKGLGYVKEWVVNRVAWERDKRRAHGDDEAAPSEGVLHSTAIESAFNRALTKYDTKPYPRVISLYRPKLNPRHVFGPDRQVDPWRRFIFHDNGWSRYCDRVEVTEVPGTHDSMVLEPNVRVLAGHLRQTLDVADAALPHAGAT